MTTRKKIVLAVVLIALSVGVVLFLLFMRMVKVPTGAMQNTILIGDRLLVSKFAQEIKRGDIIIFKYPKDISYQYVKRVIGLPGESIEIRDTKIFINGKELAERRVMVDDPSSDLSSAGPSKKPLKEISSEGGGSYSVYYLSDRTYLGFYNDHAQFGVKEPFQIPQGQYFVMGDSRDDSEDSRYWGTVPQELITGKAVLVYWSVGEDESGQSKTRWNRIFTKLK